MSQAQFCKNNKQSSQNEPSSSTCRTVSFGLSIVFLPSSHAVTHTAHSAKLTTKLYLPVDTVAVTADMSTMDQNSGPVFTLSPYSLTTAYTTESRSLSKALRGWHVPEPRATYVGCCPPGCSVGGFPMPLRFLVPRGGCVFKIGNRFLSNNRCS